MTATARLLTALAIVMMAAWTAPSADAAGRPPLAAPAPQVTALPLPPPGIDNFNPDKAVDGYLAKVKPEDKAKSDAYFEGKYTLSIIELIYTLVVAGVLLWSRASAWMRDLAASVTRSRFWQTPIYVVQYVIAVTVATLPLTYYEDFVREHRYGLSNLSFGAWAGEFAIGFAISLVALTVLLTLIYGVARAARGNWWLWGGGITVLFMAFMMMVQPVFLAPMFNHYQPLQESPLKERILSLARANGISADNVYTFDASRQSNRISANVSGFLGTTRISLNDNLLKQCTPEEVLAVMGHEMGHYVMQHNALLLTWFGLLTIALFWLIDKTFSGLTNIFGGNWDVRTIGDPAGLPLVVALIAFFSFLGTPITNTIVRTVEIQADYFGLNAARQPDAFAKVVLKLSTYRKLNPTPFEEFWYYDHPSGRTRILESMRWKAEHINDPDMLAGPLSPQ